MSSSPPSTTTIGLFYSPMTRPKPPVATVPGRLVRKFRNAVTWKANCRPREYMQLLLQKRHPQARFVDVHQEDWRASVADAEHVILLYPDCLGLGWALFEAQLAGALPPNAELSVLNGRGRSYALDLPTWIGQFGRRAAEQTMLPELVITPLFLAATPPLLVYDLLRGRR